MLKTPSSFINQILKAKYVPSTDFFNAQISHNSNFTWGRILSAQDLVRRGTQYWKIGEGDVVIFCDMWIDDDTSFVLSTPPISSFEDMVI